MDVQIPAWKVFANPTRKKIIELLRERPQTTGALCERFELSRFGVMQHLKVLEKAGLVSAEKHGRYRWNHLNLDALAKLEMQLADRLDEPSRTAEQPFVLSVQFNGAPADLFVALTEHVDRWWVERHAAQNSVIVLEARLGGQLVERFDDAGSGILLATVDQFVRNERLGLMGTLGSETALSLVRMRLESAESDSTRLTLQHRFIGSVDAATCASLQQRWQVQLGIHLKRFCEEGQPSNPHAA